MIRYFTLEDCDALYLLGCYFSNFKETNHLEEIYSDSSTKILVYEENKEILGFLMFVELQDTVDINYLFVRQNNRNKNIASCLLDRMISDLSSDIKLLTLEVRKSNLPAIRLYEKFDFSIVSERKKYYSDNEDAYLMGRRL